MILKNQKKTLDNINTNSLGQLVYEDGFFFEEMKEECCYEMNKLLIAFIRDALATFAYYTDEANSFGYHIADAAPTAYKTLKDFPYAQSVFAWKEYLYWLADKFNLIAEYQQLDNIIDAEHSLEFTLKYDELLDEAFFSLKMMLRHLQLAHE